MAEGILAGGDLNSIAQKIADMVCNTVIIIDRGCKFMAYAYWREVNQVKKKVYQGKIFIQYLDNLEKTGVIRKIRQEKSACRLEVFFSKQGEQVWVGCACAYRE